MDFYSPTWPNLAGSGETCDETGISVLFSKVIVLQTLFRVHAILLVCISICIFDAIFKKQ